MPAVPSDQLDSTAGMTVDDYEAAAAAPTSGIGFLPKLVFFAVIIAIVVLYLNKKGSMEKSAA